MYKEGFAPNSAEPELSSVVQNPRHDVLCALPFFGVRECTFCQTLNMYKEGFAPNSTEPELSRATQNPCTLHIAVFLYANILFVNPSISLRELKLGMVYCP